MRAQRVAKCQKRAPDELMTGALYFGVFRPDCKSHPQIDIEITLELYRQCSGAKIQL